MVLRKLKLYDKARRERQIEHLARLSSSLTTGPATYVIKDETGNVLMTSSSAFGALTILDYDVPEVNVWLIIKRGEL